MIEDGFPSEFVERIVKDMSSEAGELLSSLRLPPVTSVRMHPLKSKNPIPGSTKIPWCPQGYYLPERPVFTLDPLFHAGAYYVQEASSMFLYYVMDQLVIRGDDLRILDLCAAPGGKSTLLASWLNGTGLLISNEVIQSRTGIVAENLLRWGYPNTLITQNEAEDFRSLPGYFDVVVVDAPCSGEGMFRKDHGAIEEWSAANCSLCEGRQRRILKGVLPSLKENGLLIYSTCTFNPAENDGNVEWMAKELGMEIVHLNIDPTWNITATPAGGFAFYPHRLHGEGFYLCCLRKLSSPGVTGVPPARNKKSVTKNPKLSDNLREKSATLLEQGDTFYYHLISDEIYALPESLRTDLESLQPLLKLRYNGVHVATIKGNDLIPSHALALNTQFNKTAFPSIGLDKMDALRYLKKELQTINGMVDKGWIYLTYENLPLGWIKNLGNRFNNYYPIELRIRKAIHF